MFGAAITVPVDMSAKAVIYASLARRITQYGLGFAIAGRGSPLSGVQAV